ncbi:MAG TPA: hypothetical protein VFK21_00470 [Gammaproteobacteria bacterium]|nr:hypothetical protein [Gammaproteobacteria bacterium]
MKQGIAIAYLALCVATLSLPARAEACTNEEMAAKVKELGYWKNDNFDQRPILQCFAEHGADAAGLLVKQLHTVSIAHVPNQDRNKNQDSLHVIWALRSLYYITGFEFKAGSAATLKQLKLDKNREYWLLFGSGDQVNMFGVWESRDSLFVAPVDVQQAIIEKWKAWYAKDGAGFHYGDHDNMTLWYEGFDKVPS